MTVQAGPWNPGIQSQVPADLAPLCTIFRPENVYTSVAAATELRDITGMSLTELIAFRPQRLILHELLIRVTANFVVPDGSRIEDLGINFRAMTGLLLTRYLDPQLGAITSTFEQVRLQLTRTIHAALSARWGMAQIAHCERLASSATDELQRAAYGALAHVMSALFKRHGCAWGTADLIESLAIDIACNDAGSEAVGRAIEHVLIDAAQREGWSLLPRQDRPVVMNTKGPSASGKSTLRPLQKKLAGDIGVRWSDLALISPDIWRKQLLDYATLGSAYKYAGAFTADELQIVDQKLDRYMARKYERGQMSHLLIDRFRFDSFAPDSDEAGSNLLTRFGQTVYLFFMITPPELLVERAWKRGLEVGRYKAVDDTLAHGVEAYSGMADVFFTWVRRADKQVQFEFLDNSVSFGERPRTVAFGTNDTLNVLAVEGMLNIERYRRVNVNATTAQLLYLNPELLSPERNMGFLKRCIQEFREVTFADQASGRIYLRMKSGTAVLIDREALQAAISREDTRAGVQAVAPEALQGTVLVADGPQYLCGPAGESSLPTLGQWAGITRRAEEGVVPP